MITHALRVNPFIYKDLVREFWNKDSINEVGADDAGTVESTVKEKMIIVSEKTIREVLRFGDQPGFLIEIYVDQIKEVLERMYYERTFPPTLKKLLPPYWCFLAHTFEICILGRKMGADEISKSSIGAIIALIMDLDFNFSKFVFNEIKSNLWWKNKDVFLMYPTFIQMIFDDQHPDLERTGETLDMKSLGPNSFGLMKQNRKEELVPILVDDDDGSEGDDEEGDTVRFNDEDFVFDFERSDDDIDSFFENDKVNAIVISPTETEGDSNILKLPLQTPTQMTEVIARLDSTARKPPRAIATPNIISFKSDIEESQASQLPLKQKHVDPRSGVLIREQTKPAQQPTTTTEPA
ncbi:unnamed protein product [Lactuca saligna]|uniref:Uncharacterized protein n=1 Tax=Lactuca saligna TaxID=75948 RepID=A0AA35ZPJ8_LACSI|nr:unnamed protein product [Lactuca saligna]